MNASDTPQASALAGQNALPQADLEAVETALLRTGDFERVIRLSSALIVPDQIMVGAKVALPAALTVREFSVLAFRAEERVRAAVPTVTVITIEPDVYVDPQEKLPPTEAIVFLSED